MSRTLIAAFALTVTTLAASGCGESAKSLTRAELIAKTDAICQRVNAKRPSIKFTTRQDLGHALPQLAAYEKVALAELSKLVPPAPLANDWKQLVRSVQAFTDSIVKLGEYVKSNNLQTARTQYSTVGKTQDQILTVAKRNGLNDCVRVF